MRAISVRQPWAWLIVNGGKDIENRTWPTKVRGRVLIHAAKTTTAEDMAAGAQMLGRHVPLEVRAPWGHELTRGGIIGSVEIVDCVTASASPWFFGPFGFVLRNPVVLPFRPLRGALGFFHVAEEA